MAVGTEGRPRHSVVLKIVETAGAHPAQGAAVQRLRGLLHLVSLLRVEAWLLGARISRQREHHGRDHRSYNGGVAFFHVRLPPSPAPPRVAPLAHPGSSS